MKTSELRKAIEKKDVYIVGAPDETLTVLLDVVEAVERLQPRHENDGCPICATLTRLESVAVPETPTIENPVTDQEFDPKDLG